MEMEMEMDYMETRLKLLIFISLFSKTRVRFTNHRSSSQKIRSTRVQDIETLTEFQSNKIHEIFVNN